MKRRRGHCVGFVTVQILAFVVPIACEPLGCWHYSYAYDLVVSNLSSSQNSTSDCQAYCSAEPRCSHFTYAPPLRRCDVAADGAVHLFNQVIGSKLPGLNSIDQNQAAIAARNTIFGTDTEGRNTTLQFLKFLLQN